MLGSNSHEGALYIVGPLTIINPTDYEAAKEIAKILADRHSHQDVEQTATTLLKYYVGSEGDNISHEDILRGLTQLQTDIMFSVPTANFALACAGGCHVCNELNLPKT